MNTLWEISDVVAVEIAEDFCTTLGAEPGTLNPRNAARALHHAVRSARDSHLDFPALWAGYVHAGALPEGGRCCLVSPCLEAAVVRRIAKYLPT